MACENEDVSHIIVLSGEGKKDVGQKQYLVFWKISAYFGEFFLMFLKNLYENLELLLDVVNQ